MNKLIMISLLFASTLACAKPNNNSILEGDLWTALQTNQGYVISVKNQASLNDALVDFVSKNNIKSGQISGLGAVSEATLRFYDPATQKYVDKTLKKQLEISNLTGNIASQNNQPYLHLHITLGDKNYRGYAGHLLDAKIKGAGEFYVIPSSVSINRTKDSETGLNLYDFKRKK